MADLIAPQLVIDNYEQLIIDALIHSNVVSDGEITDIDPAGFMRPFVGTLAFAGSELLFTANQSAIAAAKSFLANVVGTPENVGTKARTTLQFGLSTTLATDFIVPANFQVSDFSGVYRFYTDGNLVIPAGTTTGQITATAEEVGNRFNLTLGVISNVSVPLTYLDYVTNITPSTGGSEAEIIDDLIERASQIIRIRNPVSAIDFEQLAVAIMGTGSRCKAVGLLGINKVLEDPQPGVVHLFLLDSGGNPATPVFISNIGNTLSPRIMLGTRLLISPMETFDVHIELIANSTGIFTPQILADRCWEALQTYFDYKQYPIGEPILLEEVKYAVRNVGGIIISYLDMNGDALNIPMPNQWTIPRLTSLFVELVDEQGITFRDTYIIDNPEE
jgi:hypothetical protein